MKTIKIRWQANKPTKKGFRCEGGTWYSNGQWMDHPYPEHTFEIFFPQTDETFYWHKPEAYLTERFSQDKWWYYTGPTPLIYRVCLVAERTYKPTTYWKAEQLQLI